MNFIAINYSAAKNIVSAKNLQSADFDKGKILADILKGGSGEDFSLNVKPLLKNNGLYLLSKDTSKKALLIFDTTTFNGFNKNHNEVITILQKACRLAIKLWDNIGHSPCEKIISGTSYIALLPFSFSTGKSYKVILDKSPDKERQEKRNESSFLVFQDGFETVSTEPKLSNFRKAKDGYNPLEIDSLFIRNESKATKTYINIDEISTNSSSLNPHMGLVFWQNNLTEKQKRFVFSDSFGPDILKGAAGTGKTLSLILRSVVQLNNAKSINTPLKAILITHSAATKNNIENLIVSNGGMEYLDSDDNQSIVVTTLQEWCINNLGNRISATEYLDSDALESKQLQLLYISEALEDFMINDYAGAVSFISHDLKSFFENDIWTSSLLLQEEISTYIKGRAGEDFDVYKSLNRARLTIPLKTDDDFKTIFSIFNKYQDKLVSLNLFDSDDIILSALKETSTPIWKRRRLTTGFDIIYIDETHLFNINELSLFHNLLKPKTNNLIFTMDRTQAIGDATITKEDVALELDATLANEHGLNAVFRSSEHIINLASCVLASGALLFQNLENPLKGTMSSHTSLIEEKACLPYIIQKQNTLEMIRASFLLASHISQKQQISKGDVLIVPCTDRLFTDIKDFAQQNDIASSWIEQRGDTATVKGAVENNQYLVGGIDYIGGLEFSAVIIIGIDNDKFPGSSSHSGEASHFISYSSFNRLYVAVTRAKYEVAFISEKTQKISPLLDTSIEAGLVVYDDVLAEKL